MSALGPKRRSQLCWNKNTHQPQLGCNKNQNWPKLSTRTKREGTMYMPLVIGFLVHAIILAVAFVGAMVRRRVPEPHLTEETKNLVSVSMAVVATISALVFGLMVSNANNSFNAVQGQLSAEILRLDQLLRRYGSDTKSARETLRENAERKRDDLFPKNPADVALGNQSTYELLQEVEDLVLTVKAANARDELWLDQAVTP